MNYTFDNNIMVKTTNGNFLIVPIDVYGENGEDDLILFGAMYIDDCGEYPFEIQYVADGIPELIDQIAQSEQHDGLSVRILEIINNKSNTNQILDVEELINKYK